MKIAWNIFSDNAIAETTCGFSSASVKFLVHAKCQRITKFCIHLLNCNYVIKFPVFRNFKVKKANRYAV